MKKSPDNLNPERAMTDIKNSADQPRREWVEPQVSELAVEETQGFPGRGGDGGRFVDCTRS